MNSTEDTNQRGAEEPDGSFRSAAEFKVVVDPHKLECSLELIRRPDLNRFSLGGCLRRYAVSG